MNSTYRVYLPDSEATRDVEAHNEEEAAEIVVEEYESNDSDYSEGDTIAIVNNRVFFVSSELTRTYSAQEAKR